MKRTLVFTLSLTLISAVSLQTGFSQSTAQWYVPEGAVARLGKGKVNRITYSPDGTQLVIASSIGVWGYNLDTGEELSLLTGYIGFVPSVTYSPNGRTLASADKDGTVRLWDANTGQSIAIFAGHTDWVTSVAYSPNGDTLVSGGRDNTVRLWDANTGQLKMTLAEHSRQVTSIAYSPDGKQIASSSEDSTVRLWDANTGKPTATLTRHTGWVYDVTYSPDGKRIASGSRDHTVRLWDAATGQLIATLEGHTGWVTSVAYSPDGNTLASGSEDGTVRLWNTNTRQLISPLVGHTERVTSVAYSPDGNTLASGSEDGTVRLWNANTRQPTSILTGYIDRVTSVAYSPDGSRIASGNEDGTIRLWDIRTGQSFTILIGDSNQIASVAYSPDGSTLASVGGAGDNTVHLWDITTGRSLATLTGHTSAVHAVAYSPDGSTIASAGGFGDSTVRLWNGATREPIATLTGHTRRVNTVAFSPDGDTLVSGSQDSTVRLWDANTEQLKATLTEHTDRVYTVAYSPNGATFASGSRDDTVRLWNANTGQLKATLIGHAYSVRSVAYSPDGNTLASGGEDSTVRLWDVDTGHSIATLTGHTGWVTSVVFSHKGDALASASEDGTVILWDFTLLRTREEHLQQAVSQSQRDRGQPKVQIIYFYPSDRVPQQGIEIQAERVIKDVQLFYARQMQNHGFGVKTFTLETDTAGKTVVHYVEGNFTEVHYQDRPYHKILEELDEQFNRSKNIMVIFLEVSDDILGTNVCGLGGVHREGGGTAMLPAVGDCFSFRIVAHELGHAFGLSHDFRKPNLMSGSSSYLAELSTCAAEALHVNPYFNTFQENIGSTTIQQLPSLASQSNTINLHFEVTDADGLHQAQLVTLATPHDPIQGLKLLSCKRLSGKRDTVEFTVPESTATSQPFPALLVIDAYGNVAREWDRSEVNTRERLDVNKDGVVNILDLVFVSSKFGKTGENTADANGDGIVNIVDLVKVAGEMGAGAAAPAAHPQILETLTAADVQQWLTQAQHANLTDATSQRGILMLQQLLAALVPKETSLLPNYPNPFNPETWIPYHLANAGVVVITIYDARGKVVRCLDLGHQREGYYTSRSRAAYWDGRNNMGERGASGVYFYHLDAGNISLLRKMVILK